MKTNLNALLLACLTLLRLWSSSPAFGQSVIDWSTSTDPFIEAILRDWHVPGIAIAVVQGDRVVYRKGYGLRNINMQLPVTPTTQFPIASFTKPFTGLSLAHLSETKGISLSQPIQNYWPGFRLNTSELSSNCTLLDLLTHRTGLPSHDAMWWGSKSSRQQLVERMRYLPTNLSFREAWQYSNLSYVAAGHVLERITGGSWEEYVKEYLLEPLDMPTATFTLADLQKCQDYALPYQFEAGSLKTIPYIDLAAVAPCGGLNANIDELSHFLILQLNEGRYKGKQVVSKQALQLTHTPVVIMPPHRNQEGIHFAYALGWVTGSFKQHKLLECGGQIDGFNSIISILPNQHIGVIILANTGNVQPVGIIKDHLLNQLIGQASDSSHIQQLRAYRQSLANYKEGNPLSDPDRKLGTTPSHPLSAFVGQYIHPGYGSLTVEQRQGQLYLVFNGYESVLNHFNYDTYVTQKRIPFFKQGAQFITNFDGVIDRIQIRLEPKIDPLVFMRH